MPIRHPLHMAKAAASVDQISNGRLLLGVASGDRPVEFPAFGIDAMDRSSLFKEYVQVLKVAQTTSFEPIQFKGGSLFGADVVPKPFAKEIPLFITGNSQQSIEWIAENGHGWITYPRPPEQQKLIIERWNKAVKDQSGDIFKPFTQSLYIDLLKDPNAPLTLIHLGYRGGRNNLIRLLEAYEEIGVNHVMLSLKYSGRPALEVVEELGEFVLPNFPTILKT